MSVLRPQKAYSAFITQGISCKEGRYTATEFSCLADEARTSDAMQLLIYSARVHPIKKLNRFFGEEACLDAFMAEKIKLIDEVIPHPVSIDELIKILEKR